MKIAITGASGHIGANLCRTLIEQGHHIKALINKYTRSLDQLNMEVANGNLLDINALKNLIQYAEVVIHLAATISINGKNDRELLAINVEGTKNLLQCIRENPVRRLIHFSSIHAIVHDPLDELLDETRDLAVEDHILYNRSKAVSEQLVLDAVKEGMDAVIINPTSVVGPYDFRPSLVGRALIQIVKRKLPGLVHGGYDWVDVRDIVDGTLKAIEKGRSGESYLLSGTWMSLPDLAEMIGNITGDTRRWTIMPYWLAELGVPFLKAYAHIRRTDPLYTKESLEILKTSHRKISSEKARKELGYNPRPLEETIRDTLKWFEKNGYL
jgi:dihydroflavonol-4-reductase